MERLTVPDVKIDENTTSRSVIDAGEVKKCAMQFYWHLKKIEDILGDDYDLARLRQLVEADREGRCFIAKAKVGEYIFVPNDDGEIVECRVQGVSLPVHGKNLILHLGGYPAVNLWADRENIDWWKTREAAEAVLEGRYQNEDC